MMEAMFIDLALGVALCIPLVWAARQQQEESTEGLRKLRLELHQDGWNPDRIGLGPEVEPSTTDFQRVIDSTQESLRKRGLRPKDDMFDADTAAQMREAFANDPRFRFHKDADGNLMVGLAEETDDV
jgi:hypothetical protein